PFLWFFFNPTATPPLYPLSLHDALPISIIRAVEMTSRDMPIDMVLHTPGGLVLAAEQIASALSAHPAPVTVYVPHYAMSGGTLIDRKSTRLNSSHRTISYAVFCLKKKKK